MWTPGSVLRASDSVGHPGLQSAALADKRVRLKSYDGQLGTLRLDINEGMNEGMNRQRGRQDIPSPPPHKQAKNARKYRRYCNRHPFSLW